MSEEGIQQENLTFNTLKELIEWLQKVAPFGSVAISKVSTIPSSNKVRYVVTHTWKGEEK